MFRHPALVLAVLAALGAARTSSGENLQPRSRSGPVSVAFVLTEGANVMDFAGPWEVFQDAAADDHSGFDLYTVSDSKEGVLLTGGLRVLPEHTFADAPEPEIVVVGAQKGSPAMLEWLRKTSARSTVLSVCTGAFKLAKAGLLDGLPATTHHEYFEAMEKQFPKVKLKRGLRWVQSSDRIYTAGGLTSGIDLALHIVAKYYGDAAAQRTAYYMEHSGDGWKEPGSTPVRASK